MSGAPVSAEAPGRASRVLGAVCLVASLGGLLFGFDTAVISGTVGSVQAQYALSHLQEGWFGSSALVGCILGAAGAGFLCDRYGRKRALLVSAAFFLLSALCAAAAPDFTWLVWGRIIGGVGVGVASVAAPMYITEFAPARIRGRLVAFYQLSIVVGILVAYLSNWVLNALALAHPLAFSGLPWLRIVMITQVWRAMFGVGALPAALFLGLLLLLPESPRWLAKAGRTEAALAVLIRVGGARAAREELALLGPGDAEATGSLRELFAPGLRVALLVGVGLSVFGQLSGVNIVVYYGPRILTGAAFSPSVALRCQVVLGLVNLLFTLVTIWKVDSWGRRPLLIGGMAAVAFSMGVTALLYHLGAPSLAIVAMLCLYVACLALSICGVIWVLTSEIFPTRVRGRAVSICIFANWTTNWVSAFLFPWYVATFGLASGFLTFAVICAGATLFFHLRVPETKGQTLEEIESRWRRRAV